MYRVHIRGGISHLVRRLAVALTLLCLASPPDLAAEPASIDLARALQLTLAHNRELQAYPLRHAQAEALQLQAGLRPAPSLELSVENALGSGQYEQLDSAETTLALSQVIELGDKREKRLALAGASLQQLESEYELARLDVLAETGRRYIRLLYIQARQALNEQVLAEEERALATVSARASAGAVSRTDASRLDLRLARSRARREQLQYEHALARARLAAMWQATPDFMRAGGDLARLPPPPSLSAALAPLNESPQLQQQMALQRLADARVQLAEAKGRGDLALGVGLRYLDASNDSALVFSMAMPLSFDNPNRGRISAARAQRSLSTLEADWTRKELELALTEIQLQLSAGHNRANTLQSELLPLARTLLEDTRAGYQQGRYSVLQWTDAQAERFALEQELIELRSAIHLQLLELERITGTAMTGAAEGEST